MSRKPGVQKGKPLSKSPKSAAGSARLKRFLRNDPETAAELAEMVLSGRIVVGKSGMTLIGQTIPRASKSGSILYETRSESGRAVLTRAPKHRGDRPAGPAEAADFEDVPVSVPAEVPQSLRRFLVPADGPGLLNATEAASRLEVARGTIYNWASRGVLLAWRQTGQRLYVPAEQILGPKQVVPGLPEIGAVIQDPRLLWSFLSNRQPFADEVARPIDLLRQGRIDDVVGAAKAFGLSSS